MRTKMVAAFGFLFVALPASASQNTNGDVTDVLGMHSNVVMFNQSGGPRANLPGCAVNEPQRWAIDTSTPSGQTKVAILLTAKALNKSVQVIGSGMCDVWPDTETVDYLIMND